MVTSNPGGGLFPGGTFRPLHQEWDVCLTQHSSLVCSFSSCPYLHHQVQPHLRARHAQRGSAPRKRGVVLHLGPSTCHSLKSWWLTLATPGWPGPLSSEVGTQETPGHMKPHKCKLIKIELSENVTSSISRATCTGWQIQSSLPSGKFHQTVLVPKFRKLTTGGRF